MRVASRRGLLVAADCELRLILRGRAELVPDEQAKADGDDRRQKYRNRSDETGDIHVPSCFL